MMSGKETAVVSRRGAGANAADLMEVRARDACGCTLDASSCLTNACIAERAGHAAQSR
jgi:hypothetical protein